MNYAKVKTHIVYIFDYFRECEMNFLFPPDMQKLATEAVIKQAEELAKQMS